MASCLICCQNACPQKEEKSGRFILLERQLKAVFVLQELLRLPSEKLTRFLERSGDNPEQWISLCDLCQVLVDNAFSLYENKVQVDRKLKKVQQDVILKLRESQDKRARRKDWILEESRDFAKNHEYGAFENPFLAGDLEASARLDKQASAPVKQESEPASDMDDDFQNLDSPSMDYKASSGNGNPEDQATTPFPKLSLPCAQCPLTFTSSSSRHRHVQRLHNVRRRIPAEKQMICDLCHHTFNGQAGLNIHKNVVHGTPYKHPQLHLQRRTKKVVSRKPHSKKAARHKVLPSERSVGDDGLPLFRCSVANCSKSYKTAEHLSVHKRVHDDPNYEPLDHRKLLTCPLCQETFWGKCGLQNHKVRSHPESVEKPFECSRCGERFPSHHQKYQHVRTAHLNKLPFEPAKKKKAFPAERYFQQCPHCPYKGTKLNLDIHVKMKHEGQYPFTCEHCGVGVTRSEHLVRHHVDKHGICGVKGCGVRKESKEELHEHQIRDHGKEVDLFRCPQCAALLLSTKNLKRHQKLIHGQGESEKHVCEECGKSFPFQEKLYSHKYYAHKNKPLKKSTQDSVELASL